MEKNNKINPAIFRSYDIRGVYGQDLTLRVAELLPAAFLKLVPSSKIVLGYDVRISSPEILAVVRRQFLQLGQTVINIGLVSTDVFYHACGSLNLPGIMITASHNPPEYNGFKLIKKMPLAIGAGMGMEELRDLVCQGFESPSADKKGREEKIDIWPSFIDKVLSFVDLKRLKKLKVVVDTANGAGGLIWQRLRSVLPVEIIPLFFAPDGNFPNHSPDPLKPENTKDLAAKVLATKADLGIALDADSDRCFIVDDRGERVPADFLLTLLAEYLVKARPGESIIYDVRSSWAVKEAVAKLKGEALINRVGHVHIKKRMIETKAILGGEVSGHYYFRDFYLADSGTITGLLVLDILSHTDLSLSKILLSLRTRYFLSGELNFKIKDKAGALRALEDYFADGLITKLDGLSVDYERWHFNARSSNTEPYLRLNIESLDKDLLAEKESDIIKIINKFK